ncbi:hypothetical protein ACSTHX_00510, partial [Vibrio parahaemolyticus]
TLPYAQLSLPSPVVGSTSSERGAVSTKPRGLPLAAPATTGSTEPRIYSGSGEFAPTKNAQATSEPAVVDSKDGVTLNLVGASIPELA